MECKDVTNDALADLVLDPSAPQDAHGPLFEHLASCDACRRRAAEIKAVFAEVDANLEAVPGALDAAVRSFRRENALRDAAPAPGHAAAPVQANRAFFRKYGHSAGVAAAAALVGVLFGFAIAGTGSSPAGNGARASKPDPDAAIRVAKQDDHIRSLESRLAYETARHASLAAENAGLRGEAAENGSKASDLSIELLAAGGQVTKLQEQLSESAKSGREAWDAAAAVKTSRDALLSKLGKLEADIDRKSRELALAKDAEFRLERDSAAIRAALAAAREENETLVARSAELVSAIAVRGDINGDGAADIADSMRIVALAAVGAEAAYSAPADLNGDGKVDVADAMLIARMSTGGAR